MKQFAILFLFYLLTNVLFTQICKAQQKTTTDNVNDLIQLSGVVLSPDSLQPVYYANVFVLGTKRATACNAQGFFSMVVKRGDDVHFTSVGYKPTRLTIPTNYEHEVMSVVQTMQRELVKLPEVVIRPYPSPLEFKHAFLHTKIDDDDIRRAERNLEPEKLVQLSEFLGMDGNESLDFNTRSYAKTLYYSGQTPPLQILNPFAWIQFFKALKRGDFKRKNKYKQP